MHCQVIIILDPQCYNIMAFEASYWYKFMFFIALAGVTNFRAETRTNTQIVMVWGPPTASGIWRPPATPPTSITIVSYFISIRNLDGTMEHGESISGSESSYTFSDLGEYRVLS